MNAEQIKHRSKFLNSKVNSSDQSPRQMNWDFHHVCPPFQARLATGRASWTTHHAFHRLARLALAALTLAAPFITRADREITHPYQGITWVVHSEPKPRPVLMRYALIDLQTPGLRFKLTPPRGPMETLRQSTLGFLREQSAQLAINCHFYVPYTTAELEANLVGFAASEGKVFSPFEDQPVRPEFPDQSYAILPFAPALNLDAQNRPSIVHPDPDSPTRRSFKEPVIPWNTVSGSAQIITDGVKSIPRYSGPPHGLKPLNGYSDANSWYDSPRARTAIGFTANHLQLVWFTVDQGIESGGMTVGEVADFLIQELHIYQALNLDGGPSTSIALQDPVTGIRRLMNHPPGGNEGPALGSNLCLFAPDNPEPDRLLKIEWRADQVVLSWPDSSHRWLVLESDDLNPGVWRQRSVSPQTMNGRSEVRLSPRSQTTFYRLSEAFSNPALPSTSRR